MQSPVPTYGNMIDLPLALETKQDQHEKSPDNTDSVEDNLFSEKPTMSFVRLTRIRRAPEKFRKWTIFIGVRALCGKPMII